jgi:methionine-rich copper-binding protein CopC
MMLHIPIRRAAAPVLVALLVAFTLPGVVAAHAELKTPTPADKATSTAPVTFVAGTFTQRVKADGSSLVVKLVGGTTVAQGGVDPNDPLRMVATPATPLGSGAYRVEWTTISLDDGELARGTWTFTVAVAPTPSPTPIPTSTPSAAPSVAPSASATATSSAVPVTPVPSAAPTPVPSADGSATGGSGDAVLPIVVALVVLGAGAAFLLSRRGQRPTDPT